MHTILKDFVFCADRNYIMPIQVAVASLLWSRRHNADQTVIHFLDCGLTDEEWEGLQSYWKHFSPSPASFERHIIDLGKFKDLDGWNGGLTVYARLTLPALLPDVDWCCYVDGDVLFVDDPQEISSYCRDDLALVGHKNPDFVEHIDVAWFKKKKYKCIPEKYICAGFALMNLKWMRAIGFTEQAFAFLRADKSVPTCDQTALNYYCMGKTETLPDNWAPFSVQVGQIPKISCVHFVSRLPWKTPTNWRYYANDYQVGELWFQFANNVMHLRDYGKQRSVWQCLLKRMLCVLARMLLCLGYNLHLLPLRFAVMYRELFLSNRDYACVRDAKKRLLAP